MTGGGKQGRHCHRLISGQVTIEPTNDKVRRKRLRMPLVSEQCDPLASSFSSALSPPSLWLVASSNYTNNRQ